MSVLGLGWNETAYVSTSEDAWSAFIKSRFEVLASRKLAVGPAIQSRMLDLELSMMIKYTRVAYQYSNASSGAAALPAEVLATIFTFAQVEWQPQRSTAKYDLGWVLITHVCSSWRRTAISTPSLWTTVSCLCLAPRMLPEFVRRAQQSGLQLHVDTLFCDEKMPLDIWLHEPLLRRCRRVSLIAEDEDKFIDALNLIGNSLPLPGLRDLEIKYDVGGDEWLSLKDTTFDFTSFPALHKVSLRNCFPRWDTSPLPMKNLTHLSLMMSWYSGAIDDETFRPAALIFRQMLDALPLLTELTLTNLLPAPTQVAGPHDGVETYPGFAQPFVFSTHLRRLTVEVHTIYAYSIDYRYFWDNFRVPSTTVVVVDLNIDSFDARMESDGEDGRDWLIPITCVDNAITPAQEMTISQSTVSVRYAESSEDTWTRRSDIETRQNLASDHTRTTWIYRNENWDTDTVHGSRHIYVPSDLSAYIDTLPLASMRALFLVSNLMPSMTSPSAWVTSFAEAQDVQRLSFGYAASGHLLVALSRMTVGSDNARYLSLFPQLDTLILHADEDTSRENTRLRQPALELSLLDVLAVRKDAGAPVLQIYVDESMSEWDVWTRIDDGVVVSFFQ
ncbi:hypothetical protein PENSPDRAFT_754950 [Peniophora sp. CONT]|nr:hypothetical protein PENSPDRAFT_754950 [Peniophora sp. CONT]